MGFRTGMKVLVKQLGEAIIVKLTDDGALVKLFSPTGLTIKQSYDNIAVINEENDIPQMLPPVRSVADMDKFLQIKALEALRFGLVPESHLESLTVGYQDMAGWIGNCLPVRKCSIHEICGPFGTGKSHTMALVRQIALDKGYLASKIEIDGKSNNFSAPQRLLYNIWLSLEGKGLSMEMPLLHIYLKAMQNGYDSIPKPLKDLDYFPGNFDFIRKLKTSQQIEGIAHLLEECLAGSENVNATQVKADLAKETNFKRAQINFKPMIAKGARDKFIMFIMSLAGHALLAKAAGYRGLVVTMDEFEAHRILSSSDRAKARELISVLENYVSQGFRIPPAPLAIFIGAVSQDGHKGDPWVEDLVESSGGEQYFLTPWSDAQKEQLANSIFNLYKSTYQLSDCYDQGLIDKTQVLLESHDQTDLVRAFIKYYMAVLDNEYGPGRPRTNGN